MVVENVLDVGCVLERLRPEAVGEREFGRASDVGFDDRRTAVEGGERSRGARRGDVPTVAVDAGITTQCGDFRGVLSG